MSTIDRSDEQTDSGKIEMIVKGDDAVFEMVFKMFFKRLHSYAFTIVKDGETAEEIVQLVFMKIWEKKTELEIKSSLKAYLYRTVYNESVDYLRRQKVKWRYNSYLAHSMKNETDNACNGVMHNELEDALQRALDVLPPACRIVFELSRFEELKYHEIADRLDVSIKTVEKQMTKALKTLRLQLIDYLPSLIFVLWIL